MNRDYNFKEIEEKWQQIWGEEELGKAEDFADKPKHYHLVEFPYPSGAGLHVGHCMGYGASDAYCRMKRLQGFNVMYPMGWDAFGLPTENFAIKNKIKPADATKKNVETFKSQMKSLGYSFDWSREINTTDPDYFRFTQWIFLQFFKHAIVDGKLVKVADDDTTTPRLAFQAEMPVNWCPSCKIILANEEVIGGNCERCGAQTEKRKQKQWMLRITAYADRLIKDLDTVDYLEKIKTQQINWIGKSVGAEIDFDVKGRSGTVDDEQIKVFTTRPDTIYGCTYLVISPEHPIIRKLGHHIQNFEEIKQYQIEAKKKSDLERTELQKDKTGVKLFGIFAINPINNEQIPIYVADYVLATYGTGAIMAVPAHDERDWEFAEKFNIPIRDVIAPEFGEKNTTAEERHTVTALAKRPSDGKYLALKWKNFDWIDPVIGGVEKEESPIEAVKREVLEETGYHVKPIKKIGVTVVSHFYAEHKKVWRKRLTEFYYCELADEQPAAVNQSESDQFEPIWLSKDECLNKLTFDDHKIGFRWLFNNEKAYSQSGVLINSGEFDGLSSEIAKEKIIEKLEKIGKGKKAVNFKLRDWIFSRQHYWGEPIPIVHCEKCGMVPVLENQLPVVLPDVENYEPTDTGESPLAKIKNWVETTCPKCKGSAKRETDTMPNWAGSSWYFLAYAMAHNLNNVIPAKAGIQANNDLDSGSPATVRNDNLFDKSKDELKYWMPVDLYNGGMEHTTLHLLYSRFWNKFLFDLGVSPVSEPYAKRIAHGIILGPDGRKMSKSFGNVINPDDIVKEFGADTLRAYIMFIGPYDQESAWSRAGVQGVFRFLKRVWKNNSLISSQPDDKALLIKLNQTIIGISSDLEGFQMNTVISKLMELNNTIEKTGHISKDSYAKFLLLLYPVAPFIASELWEISQFETGIEASTWPVADENYIVADKVQVVVQINGKVRDKLDVEPGLSDETLRKLALESEKIKDLTNNQKIAKVIVVPNKLVSIVLSK